MSPSRLARFNRCQLQLVLDTQTRGRGGGQGNAASSLGLVVHLVLQSLCETGAIKHQEGLGQTCAAAWDAAVREVFPAGVKPGAVPGYFAKRARLPNAAHRLSNLLDGYPDPQVEKKLSTQDGRIVGTPDLYAIDGDRLLLVDYKSGIDREESTGKPLIADYERQLQLYGYVLHDNFGMWPERAVVLPLDGEAIDVAVNPSACKSAADQAHTALATCNVPDYQAPPSPSPAACRFCQHLLACDAFLKQCTEEWAQDFRCAIGEVSNTEVATNGTVSLALSATAGSVRGQIAIISIEPQAHPEARELDTGTVVSASGIFPANGTGTAYKLNDWSRLIVTGSRDLA